MKASNLAITIDDNYIQHCVVMLESLRNCHPDKMNVHVVYAQLSEENIRILKSHFQDSDLNFDFHKIDNIDFSFLAIKENDHVSIATYFRILLPEILTHLEQVLFLDCDLIINSSLSEILQTDIANFPVGAVEDLTVGVEKKSGLAFDADAKYFNAGVLLINLKYFRDYDVTRQALDFIKLNPEKCEYWDQDALNAVIRGNFVRLPLKYNVQSDFFNRNTYSDELASAIESPAIVHFTGGGACKPWFYENRNPFKHLYYKYLNLTPFYQYRQPDVPSPVKVVVTSIKKVLKKCIHAIRPKPKLGRLKFVASYKIDSFLCNSRKRK